MLVNKGKASMLYDLKLSTGTFKPVVVDPYFDTVRATIIKQIKKIVNYYRTRSFTINTEHLLVRLLYQLDVDPTLNLTDYVEAIKTQIPRLEGVFNIYGIHGNGALVVDFLYGKDSYDYLVSVDSEIDYFTSYDKWKDIESIYPIYHTDYDLSLIIPINNKDRVLPSYSVILVDIVLLAIQYKRWIEQSTIGETDIDPTKFIRSYVLPNLLARHVDICIINRLFQLDQYDTASPTYTIESQYPFYVTDVSNKLDKVLKKYIETVKSGDYRFVDILYSLPTVSYRPDTLLRIPYLPPMVQLLLPLWLSRIELLYHLTQLASDRTIEHDRTFLNDIKTRLQLLLSKQVMKKLPIEIGYVGEMMQYLIRL